MTDALLTRRLVLSLAVGAAAACSRPGGDDAVQASNTRDIPMSLWLGGGSEGDAYPEVDLTSGRNKNRRLRGPFEWINPRTGDRHLVYERTKTQKRKLKRQVFTVTHGGQGVGRLLDERTDRAPRNFEGDILFPLGEWADGERRSFEATEYTVIGPARRSIEIRIKALDYTYKGAPHSLKFDWIATDAAGRTLYRERYIYSPGVGLAKYENLLNEKPKSS